MMRRWLYLGALASALTVLAACGRTDTPATKPTEAARPAAPTTAPVIAPTTAPTEAPQAPPTTAPPPPTQAAAPAPPAAQRVRVTGTGADGVNMRAEPSTAAPRVKGLTDGKELEIVGADRQADGRAWRKVKDPADGASGWVAADFLAAVEPATPAPPVAEKPAAPAPTATQAAAAQPTSAPKPSAPPAAMAPAAPTAVPKVVPTMPPAPKPAGNCHPSYPDFCIPPAPPDLNCNSAVIGGRKNFTVRQPDPHGFDGNKDGIGCERR